MRPVALRSDKPAVKTKFGRRNSDVRSPAAPLEHSCHVTHIIAVHMSTALAQRFSESFVMSLHLYCAFVAHSQRLNVLFLFNYDQTANLKSCCCDKCALDLLTFILRL